MQKLSVILVLFLSTAKAATVPELVNKLYGGELGRNHTDYFPQFKENIEREFLVKTLLPSYAKEFLHLFNNSHRSDFSSLLARLLDGVESKKRIGHSLEWIWRMMNITEVIKQGEKEAWALQMIDAWGKPPEGVLSGHINLYGDFYECIGIKVRGLEKLNNFSKDEVQNDFEGQYCTAYLVDYASSTSVQGKSRKSASGVGVNEAVSVGKLVDIILNQKFSAIMMIPSIGICVPNTCSHADTQKLMFNIFNITYSQLLEDEISPENLPWPMINSCTVEKKKDFDAAVICVIVVLAILFGLGFFAGIYDYWLTFHDKTPSSSKAFKYFMAFSLYTNTKKWLSTRRSAEDFGCLHGIRFLSMAWVHRGIHEDWTVMSIINGSFSVDTFFLMSGTLATYSILKMLDKTKGKFNILMFYIHRYIRLTPTYAILIGIAATLTTYAGNGPFWTAMEGGENNCRKNWWINLLYINNVYKDNFGCHGEAWYLANDMQFYIVSPFIVYPIWKWRRIGLALLSIYTALSCITIVLVTRYTPTPYVMADNVEFIGTENDVYLRPWTRISPFLVGIWLGWILHETKGKRLKLSLPFILLGWAMATGTAIAVLFGVYPWFNPSNTMTQGPGLLYAGLSRFAWGVAIAWIIFACLKGYGGLINSFLSWKVFMPLGRLTFCVYLTSVQVQVIFYQRIAVPLRYDSFTMVNLYLGQLVLSCMVGFICTIFFESPFIILHKLIFEGDRKIPTKTEEHNSRNH